MSYVIRSGSPSGIILRIAMSTGLMNLDCSGSLTMKDLQSTDLKQENMDYKHGANEE